MGRRDTEMENDAELWARIARTAEPLRRERGKPAPVKPAKPPAPPPKTKSPTGSEKRLAPKPAPKISPSPSGTSLDRQTARRLETGRLAVEARLDLHGMRQRDAHAALRKFLKSAQAKGHRHVLVITGKGAASDERKSFYAGAERGVLRQSVPYWLSQPDLASLVVSYSVAPRRLGGDGALYVRLRKPQR